MTTSGAAAGRTPSRRRGDSGAHRAAGSDAAGPAAEPSTTDTEPDDSMNVDAIKQILDLVREHELTEFELEQGGVKLRVKKQGAAPPAAAPAAPQLAMPAPAVATLAAVPAAVSRARRRGRRTARAVHRDVADCRHVLPLARSVVPVVRRGRAAVKKGQALCIIEAMKLMNEIESEYEGEIVKVYVENGQPVQYGERLFAVKTT